MAATRTFPQKRFSRKGRIPTTIGITPALKANLARLAKQEGMSLTAFTSLVMEQIVFENTIKEAVDKELEHTIAPLIFLAAESASQARQTNRILRRVLEDPTEDIETIVKQVEEEAIN